MRALLILCLAITSGITSAQGTKRVTKSNKLSGEIYYVLKENKDIKQGQYFKYYQTFSDKAIDSYGHYDNNERTGTWIFCDVNHLKDPLISIGSYSKGKKEGQWIYFYSPPNLEKDAYSLLNAEKLTSIYVPSNKNEEFQVSLDTTGIKIAATGNYLNDKKTGIWSYYSLNDTLLCKFDFSANRMIYSKGLKNYDQLGGINRFIKCFYLSLDDTKAADQLFVSNDSNVTLEISTDNDKIQIQQLKSKGNPEFAKLVEDILRKMSNDWINYDPRLEHNKLHIVLNYVRTGNVGRVTLDSIKPLMLGLSERNLPH